MHTEIGAAEFEVFLPTPTAGAEPGTRRYGPLHGALSLASEGPLRGAGAFGAGLRRRREAVHFLPARPSRPSSPAPPTGATPNSGSNSAGSGSPPPPTQGKPKSWKLKKTTKTTKRELVVRLRHISRVMRVLVLGRNTQPVRDEFTYFTFHATT
ncbi:hypothetical protein C8J57DRAFT_1526883 [Mycena rebaudengoi]|nr:hypothetical protein C8J57DRAFT_1526883 [Mycena rebaudengoi]